MPGTKDIDDALRQRSRRNRLMNNETYAAFALAAATIIALVWANVGHGYVEFWHTATSIQFGAFQLDLTFHEWVDEGLMTLFFFMVGLDVRRELSIGELRLPGRAMLPIVAALGGLIVPTVVFLAITAGSGDGSAWGTVISTDTAFVLGMLALIGPRNAPRLRLFVLALAVIDDIGALSVIGLFYTDDLKVGALALAAVGLAGVWALQRFGVWRVLPYLVLGALTWYAMYTSGVHATLAGVLLALLMPVHSLRRQDLEHASDIFHLFRQAPTPGTANTVRDSLLYAIPLNQRLSAVLPRYVNFLVVPLFALANAGVALSGEALGAAVGSVLTWGVIGGLVLGKFIGITLASALVLRWMPSARLPGLDLPRIAGVAVLSGMGFTISLLVVGLALDDPGLQEQARVGVLAASVLALALATVIFKLCDRFAPLPTPEGDVLRRAVDPERDHIFGRADAPNSLVVYTALNYVYRSRMEESLREAYALIDQDRVRFVYRHHATNKQELTAALALEAAAAKGRFWDMHDALVRVDGEIDEHAITAVATALGLDADTLWERITEHDDIARIEDDTLDIHTEEQDGEPIVYFNDDRVRGPINRWRLTELLNEQ